MKINLHYRKFLVAALLVGASLGLVAAWADDNQQGGNISGSESSNFEVMMTPTSAAPSGSSIKASLEADDEDGATTAKLKLESHGLPAGTYSVSVTLKSDGSTVPLGTFIISATPTPTPTPIPTASPTPTPTATPTGTPGDDDGENDDDNGDNNDNQGDNGNGGDQGCEFGTGTSLPFPAGFNPFDIATISVSDSNGVVLFTADLTNVSTTQTANFSASVMATAGPGNPGVSGAATLSAAHSGKSGTGSLQLTGHGIRPNIPLTFAINGNSIKSVKSDKHGNVNVLLKTKGKTSTTIAPGVNLFKVTSVGLHDKHGTLILGASF